MIFLKLGLFLYGDPVCDFFIGLILLTINFDHALFNPLFLYFLFSFGLKFFISFFLNALITGWMSSIRIFNFFNKFSYFT